jgi:hypothetical protein
LWSTVVPFTKSTQQLAVASRQLAEHIGPLWKKT